MMYRFESSFYICLLIVLAGFGCDQSLKVTEQPVCPALMNGEEPVILQDNASIATMDDLEALKDVSHVAGDLVITTDFSGNIDLPNLCGVNGDLRIEKNPDLSHMTIPSLGYVDGDVYVYENDRLRKFSAPQLIEVGGSFYITDNPKLTALHIQSVQKIAGDMWLNALDDLDVIYLPVLAEVGLTFRVASNDELYSLNVDSLHTIGGGIRVLRNDDLPSLVLPALETIVGAMRVQENNRLQTILVGGENMELRGENGHDPGNGPRDCLFRRTDSRINPSAQEIERKRDEFALSRSSQF